LPALEELLASHHGLNLEIIGLFAGRYQIIANINGFSQQRIYYGSQKARVNSGMGEIN
jgi:uncharacterized membrane protein YuzA (DUF378 family)